MTSTNETVVETPSSAHADVWADLEDLADGPGSDVVSSIEAEGVLGTFVYPWTSSELTENITQIHSFPTSETIADAEDKDRLEVVDSGNQVDVQQISDLMRAFVVRVSLSDQGNHGTTEHDVETLSNQITGDKATGAVTLGDLGDLLSIFEQELLEFQAPACDDDFMDMDILKACEADLRVHASDRNTPLNPTVNGKRKFLENPEDFSVLRKTLLAAAAPTKHKALPSNAKATLMSWVREHVHHPYPSADEKESLMKQTGLTSTQVGNWFINVRKRQWIQMKAEADKAAAKTA